jgi:phosphoglycerate dehydrogenase-like enzyme
MQIGILEPKDFSNVALDKLSEIGEVELFDGKDLNIFISNKETIFTRLKYFLDKDFLDSAYNLKYICSPTTGLNHLDLDAFTQKKIKVISLKGEFEFLSSIRATPEHTFGLVLSLLRNYKDVFLAKDNFKWDREQYKGFELSKNSVGIIGFGRVGRQLSKYFDAFDTKVYFYDIDQSIKEVNNSIKLNSIKDLIQKSNIVILSASYSNENFEFFDKKYIDLLENKYFINIARGELVEESYLLQKIEQFYFKGVALDVLQNEQSNHDLNKIKNLINKKNFILTPHIAGATYSSMHRTEEFIVDKLHACLIG